MPRLKGTGKLGATRSVRLPLALDRWFEERLAVRPHVSPSELLVELILGGLRLRDGYMSIHKARLETFIKTRDHEGYHAYLRTLDDTFSRGYVDHLVRWLAADGFALPSTL